MDVWLYWFAFGIALLLLEMAAPGIVLLFFGAGACLVSLTTGLGLTETLLSQVLLFTFSSIILLVTLRKTLKKSFIGNDEPTVIDEEYIGHQVKVIEAIAGGSALGKVEHKGATWKAISDSSCAVDSQVEIVAVDGLTLTVKPLKN